MSNLKLVAQTSEHSVSWRPLSLRIMRGGEREVPHHIEYAQKAQKVLLRTLACPLLRKMFSSTPSHLFLLSVTLDATHTSTVVI